MKTAAIFAQYLHNIWPELLSLDQGSRLSDTSLQSQLFARFCDTAGFIVASLTRRHL